MKKLIYLSIVICSIVFAGVSIAEEATLMDEVVVTAGRIEEKKEDVTTNITTYTQEDIQQSSIQDLSDLLAKEGFMIREYPNSTISVSIRGFRTETHGNDLASHVLILINGRRAGTGNLAKITMDNVERVEVIRGPGSVQYGASAMGGVVNVITKKGEDKPSLFVEGTLGSWDYKQTSVGFSGEVNSFDFSATVSKSSQDDYDTADGSCYYNTGYDSKERLSLNAGWTFVPGNRIGFTYSGYEGDEIGQPGYLSSNDLDDHIDNSLKTFDVFYDGQSQDGFLSWSLLYFKGKDEYETYDNTIRIFFRDTDNQGAQAQVTAKWDIAHVTTGVDWTDYAIRNTYSVAGKENTYNNPAVFILAKTKLMDDKLVLSAGGRYDKYEVESDDGQSKDASNWSTSVGMVFKFTPGFSVRTNYAEAFRMPTANELYMYDDYSAWGWGIYAGNTGLDPEKSKTYEIGLDYSKNSFTAGITYFHTDFDDKIDTVYDAGTNTTTFENIEGATLSGFEGTLQWDIGALFGWSYELIPYSSFAVFTEYENDATNEDLKYTPEWTASYGLKFINADLGFYSRLNFSYVGEQDITDYEGTGETTLKSYSVADLMISKQLFSWEKYGAISLQAEATNLFNESYAAVQGYPMPGRSFYIGIRYKY